MNDRGHMNLALLVSIVAAALIAIALFSIYFVGVYGIFHWPYIILLIGLLILGFPAYYGYSRAVAHAGKFIRYATPLAFIFAFIGIIMGSMHDFLGIIMLFLAYIIEEATGLLLRLDFREISNSWTNIFITGMTIFVASILLVLISTKLVIVPIIGDVVKGIGIYGLYRKFNSDNT
ncbi:MAG: hypothetical protein RXO28_04675 [Thermocladium sp.]|jgi:hypothetical protein